MELEQKTSSKEKKIPAPSKKEEKKIPAPSKKEEKKIKAPSKKEEKKIKAPSKKEEKKIKAPSKKEEKKIKEELEKEENKTYEEELEEQLTDEEIKNFQKSRWNYKIKIKRTPVSTESIENAPCLTCPVEQKCSLEGEISPLTCQLIEDWVLIEITKSKK